MTGAALLLLARVAAADPVVAWDLDEEDGGFASGGETAQWAWGPVTSGPRSGLDGPNAWATRLAGPHLNDTTDTLTLPAVDLSGIARPILTFAHWYALDAGDVGRVEVFDGASWITVAPVYGYPTAGGYTGASNGWLRAWFDLTGVPDAANVRLVLQADAAIALDGWYVDAVAIEDGDAVPPAIRTIVGPSDNDDLLGPHLVSAEVLDDLEVRAVEVAWTANDGPPQRAPLTLGGGDRWTGEIDPVPADTVVEWWLEASDGANTATSSERTFRVALPPPTDVAGPARRVVSRSVPLTWTAPDTDWPVVDYVVRANGVAMARPTGTSATVSLLGADPEITVAARFETPDGESEGDESDPIVVPVAWPAVTGVDPPEGFQGDHLRLSITGSDLLLAAGEVSATLGPGVSVVGIDVVDVSTATVTVDVAAGAAPGPRDLVLTIAGEEVPLAGAFTVLDGADRPAIARLSPDVLTLGERDTLVLTLTAAPAGAVTLDAGAGVVVEELVVAGVTVTARVAVAPDAPVGSRSVVIDDGVRFFEGPALLVRKPAAPAGRVCATTRAAPGLWWAGLALLGAAARRRRGGCGSGRNRA